VIVAIIDPWAGAVSSLIGNFTSDYFMVGLGAIPALVGPWCYLAFGHIMRKEGKTLRKLLLGSVICIVWITFTLTIGFWLLQVMPITTAFYLILTSITLTFILSDLVMIPILPRLYQFIRRRQKEN
jgi:cobalamin biosynthesis protein CobD/CbiB